MPPTHSTPCNDPLCAGCKHHVAFEMPKHLVKAAEEGRLVIFSGAGVSTENRMVFPDSLAEEIRSELDLKHDLPFSAIMSAFCEQPDGRSKLLRRIRDRINYVRSYRELYWAATLFHRELATMWQIQEIITTNWDDFFERECGATPFVTDKDLAFWSTPGRKVLKLHGSIHSLGEMVVTNTDYQRCYERLATGVLGSRLKTLLSNRTVAFVGYSLHDSDLQQILDLLTKDIGDLRPTYYVITPEECPPASERWPDIRHIRTDGTHFLRQLKAQLLKSGCTLHDERFHRIPVVMARLREAHRALFKHRPLTRYPEGLYCASYQDGLQHALDRIDALASSGAYSHECSLEAKIRRYEVIRATHLRKRNYIDAAYSEGFRNGMILLAEKEDTSKEIPLFYVFGAEKQPRTFAAYRRLAADAARIHKTSFLRARRIVKAMGVGTLDIHHRPFLDTYVDEEAVHS